VRNAVSSRLAVMMIRPPEQQRLRALVRQLVYQSIN
jgi:hypothetical protein